jgi:hypothetical protein
VAASRTDETRRGRGFRSAASLVERRIRDAGQTRGFLVTRLITHWAEIVGDDLARLARPANVSHRRGIGGTLSLLCSGSAAPMVQMQIPRIIEKVNACYGYAAISHVRVTQTAPEGFAEPAVAFRADPPAAPRPDVEAPGAAEGVLDPELREALQTLAANVRARRR